MFGALRSTGLAGDATGSHFCLNSILIPICQVSNEVGVKRHSSLVVDHFWVVWLGVCTLCCTVDDLKPCRTVLHLCQMVNGECF